ncbi:LemA family protein [Candidatus Microthrix parvicella]|uniref:LemA protein n=1 Tax=Candidatus Neomicrothrix parvicella RN1 TaxID=1229780 RepID=R4Z2S4_9ACTN|nr:LemA family protein [Candidatus Microthrix parvicella]CCM64955.1 LemA protein [Candidatus Microthrix parvicella RN1]
MKVLIALVIIIVVLAVGFGLYLMGAYNGLVKLRNKIESAFAQIDVQLNRRHDLIPNLVETVRGYATHEKETLEGVIAARNAAVAATGPEAQAEAEGVLSGMLKQVFALSEAYPDLKANSQFLDLQRQLSETEDRIAYSRQYFNDNVRTYNTKIQSFPQNLIAKKMGFTERAYFQADETSRANVQVEF